MRSPACLQNSAARHLRTYMSDVPAYFCRHGGRRGLLPETISRYSVPSWLHVRVLLACSPSGGGLVRRTAERAGCRPLRWGSWAVYGRARRLLPPSSGSILLGTFLKSLQRSYLSTFPKFLQRSQQLVWWKLPSSTYISREVYPVNILTPGLVVSQTW